MQEGNGETGAPISAYNLTMLFKSLSGVGYTHHF